MKTTVEIFIHTCGLRRMRNCSPYDSFSRTGMVGITSTIPTTANALAAAAVRNATSRLTAPAMKDVIGTPSTRPRATPANTCALAFVSVPGLAILTATAMATENSDA